MTTLSDFDPDDFWKDSDYARREYVDEPLNELLLGKVERELGYTLPRAYVDLCRTQNGGIPKRTCHRTASRTSWAADHVAISAIKGIGFKKIWSLCGDLGQRNAVDEWQYPRIGVYFGDCASAGHDHICLDYRHLNEAGEPTVVHVDQELDYRITPVAESFEAFIRQLQPDAAFPLS